MNKSLICLKVLFLSLIFFLISCSNPIDDGELMSSRSARNSNILVFDIGTKDDCGITEPEGEVSYKVGGKYNICFYENENYQFEKWEVVNKETGKLISDVISFEDKNSAETNISVLHSVDNVLLRAVAKKRPLYISKFPEFLDSGVYSDSVIVVNFDKKISDKSFYYTSDELNKLNTDSYLRNDDGNVYGYIFNNEIYFKNIFISSSSDKNLLEHFNPPALENGRILKLIPKKNNPLIKSATMDIDVFISPDIIDEDGVSYGKNGISWRYRINSNTDVTSPKILSFTLKNEDTVLEPGKVFNPKNHIKGKLNFTYSVSDDESGVNFVQIESKRIQTKDGKAVNEEPVIEILKNTDTANGVLELQNDDGLIQITFSVCDYSGNMSKNNPVYLIAKDTSVDVSKITFFNRNSYKDGDTYNLKDIIESSKTVCWKNELDDVWNLQYSTSSSSLSYSLLWGNSKGNYSSKIVCSKERDYSNGVWAVNLPVLERDKQTYICLEVTDEIGNKAVKETIIPAAPAYFTYQRLFEPGDTTAHYRIFYSKTDNKELEKNCEFGGYLFYSENDSDLLKVQSFTGNKYTDIFVSNISDCSFYFQLSYINDFSCLLSAENNFRIVENDSVKAPCIDEIVLARGQTNSKKNIATVKYQDEPEQGIAYELFWGTDEEEIINYEQSDTFEIDSGIETLYYKTVYVDSKNNISKTSEILSYDLSSYNFDTIPPVADNIQCICGYYPIVSFDIHSDNYIVSDDDNAEYIVYTVPVESANVTFDELAEEDIKSSAYTTYSFVPPQASDQTVKIWNVLEGSSEAECYFYVFYFEDEDGNYTYVPVSYNKHLLENKPGITYSANKDNSDLVDVKFKITQEEYCTNYQIEYDVYNEKNEVNKFETCSCISEKRNSLKQRLVKTDDTYSTEVSIPKGCFYFVFSKALYSVEDYETVKYSYPVYFYTDLGNSVKCELKEFVDEMNGAQIYCDRPCLVMTYWSSENYEFSVDLWETYGVQSNPMYISAKNSLTNRYEDTFRFYKVNRDEIPMGKYFVIIAYFADGTTKISKIINTN